MIDMVSVDRLIVDGVNYLGYGTVPKAVMQDRALPIRSKALYAYYCSLSGNGTTAFPSRDTIHRHLGLGNQSYYSSRKYLEEQGYLLVEQRRIDNQTFATNFFTLVTNPKKFEDIESDDLQGNTIQKSGLKSGGYGEIPRAVMFDQRLDIATKGVYAYFASFAGAGRSAFPSVPRILADLQISHNTYHKAIGLLQKYGFLEIRQRNNAEGKKGFGANDYILLDKPIALKDKAPDPEDLDNSTQELCGGKAPNVVPQPKKENTRNQVDITGFVENLRPHTKNPHTEKTGSNVESVENFSENVENLRPCTKNPHTAFSPYTSNPHTRKPHTKNQHTNNNKETNNKSLNTSFYYPSIMGNSQFEKSDQIDSIDFWKEELRDSVHYEDIPIMSPQISMSSIDFLISLMADACAGEGTVRIGKQDMPKETVRQVFTSLDWDHLVYVLECVANQSSEIKNIRAYYLTALYRAPETMEAYYDQMVARNETESRKASYLA